MEITSGLLKEKIKIDKVVLSDFYSTILKNDDITNGIIDIEIDIN